MLILSIMTELSQRISKQQLQEEAQIELRKHHIKIWRYRVYIFFLLVIAIFIEPYFTQSIEDVRWVGASKISLTNISWWFQQRGEWGKFSELEQVKKQITETKGQIEKTKIEIAIVNNLQNPSKQNTILNCINANICDAIQPELIERMDLLRSYLIVNKLSAEKLDFDQKFILRNINEFLIQEAWKRQLVELTNINFGEPKEIKPEFKLYTIPVHLEISYSDNNDFMEFLRNIERRMSPTLPIMRRIETVSYDIVNYLDSQEVAMDMSIYYFKFSETKQFVWETQEIPWSDHASPE